MNQNVNPVVAFFVIAILFIIIAFKFWAHGEALSVRGPDQMQFDPQGNLYIHITDTLYKLSPRLELLDEYPLQRYGVHDMVGDFAFFSNGDMLIRRGTFEPSLLQNIFGFLRMSDALPASTYNGDDGLHRCDVKTAVCTRFGTDTRDFDSAFHLAIDGSSDDVYLSDTSRHALYKFDKDGNLVGKQLEGYKFPNQISLINNMLYIADTNHHSIKVALPLDASFGDIDQSYRTDNNAYAKNRWPYSFACSDNLCWVNNMDSNMSHGEVLLFGESWNAMKKLDLPKHADPLDIAILEKTVLITDMANNRIHTFDRNGSHLNLSLPDAITNKLALNKKGRDYYEWLDTLGTFGLIGFIGLGFVAAFIHARIQGKKIVVPDGPKIELNIKDPGVNWIEKNTRKILVTKILLGALLIFLIVMATRIYLYTYNTQIISRMAPAIFVSLWIMYLTYRQAAARIGYIGKLIVLQGANGKYSVGKGNRVFYSDTHILIDDVYMMYKNPKNTIFDQEVIMKEILPRLQDSNYITRNTMFNMIVARLSKAEIAAFVVGLGLTLILIGHFL